MVVNSGGTYIGHLRRSLTFLYLRLQERLQHIIYVDCGYMFRKQVSVPRTVRLQLSIKLKLFINIYHVPLHISLSATH